MLLQPAFYILFSLLKRGVLMENDNFVCENCNNKVDDLAKYCPDCGSLFEKNILCSNHPENDAEGVCIICDKPYCEKCGMMVNRGYSNDIFLCEEHSNYEIIEGMARIYGTFDDVQAQFICDCLEKEGLHPFLYYRAASLLHPGGESHTLYDPSGSLSGHVINEDKIMVPCKEVIKAEAVLKDSLKE
jgi:hypothetical protein